MNIESGLFENGLVDADEKLNLIHKLMNDNNWEVVTDDGNIKIERKFTKNCPLACFRSSGFVNANAEELLDYVSKIYENAESIKRYDIDVSHYEIVEKLSENSRLCYQINSMQWPIWPRDTLYVQIMKNFGENYWLYMYSDESPIRPKRDDQYVRAIINISAYGFYPEKDGCRVYRLAQIDPCGSIPTSVVNSYAEKTASVIKLLQQIYPA